MADITALAKDTARDHEETCASPQTNVRVVSAETLSTNYRNITRTV